MAAQTAVPQPGRSASNTSSWYSGWSKLASYATVPLLSTTNSTSRDHEPEQMASLTLLQSENRRLTEALQKAQLEKALLKDLVEKAYGNESEGPGSAPTSVSSLLDWQHDKAILLARTEEAEGSVREVSMQLARETQRASLFEAEISRLQSELRALDNEAATYRKFKADQELLLRRLEAEIQARTAAEVTVSSLMDKISFLDSRKTDAADDATEEIHKLRQRIGELEAHLASAADDRSRANANDTPTDTLPATEEPQQEAHPTTEELQDEILVLDEKIRQLEATITSQSAALANADEEYAVLQGVVDRHEAIVAELRAAASAAWDAKNEAETQLTVVQEKLLSVQCAFGEAKSEVVSLRGQRDALENTLRQGRVELDALHEVMDNKDRDARSAQVAFAAERSQWAIEKAGLQAQIDLLNNKIVDAETNAGIKIRTANVKVKELQAQLAAAIKAHEDTAAALPGVEAGTDPRINALHEENLSLIDRIAVAQEQVWSLQTAKKTYEAEIMRLNAALREKTEVVRQHFESAAHHLAEDRHSASQGVTGYLYAAASLVSHNVGLSSAASADRVAEHQIDVIDAMQTKMETVLVENINVRQELATLKQRCAELETAAAAQQKEASVVKRDTTSARLPLAVTSRRRAYKTATDSPGRADHEPQAVSVDPVVPEHDAASGAPQQSSS